MFSFIKWKWGIYLFPRDNRSLITGCIPYATTVGGSLPNDEFVTHEYLVRCVMTSFLHGLQTRSYTRSGKTIN